MKFLASNFPTLCLWRPAHASVKEGCLSKSSYFTDIGSSNVINIFPTFFSKWRFSAPNGEFLDENFPTGIFYDNFSTAKNLWGFLPHA